MTGHTRQSKTTESDCLQIIIYCKALIIWGYLTDYSATIKAAHYSENKFTRRDKSETMQTKLTFTEAQGLFNKVFYKVQKSQILL